jgi:hypothetical protein
MRRTARALASGSLLALATAWACCAAPAGASSTTAPTTATAPTATLTPLPASDYDTRPLCAAPQPRSAGCLALKLLPRTAAARAHTHPLAVTTTQPIKAEDAAEGAYGFTPQDLHSGYELPTEQLEAQTKPQTIGIVDAFDDAHAEADLEVYDQEFGLPACTHANGCFTKVNQNGQSAPLPGSTSAEAKGWAGEIATDVETAHAICEDCHILLVEAVSPENTDLGTAEDTAVRLGATEVSDSWGGPESPGEDTAPFEHPGTVITAAAGDTGYLDWDNSKSSERGRADFPATSPDVIAVGGTRLILHAAGRAWKEESVWNGDEATGGGCSVLYSAPSWQPSATVGCGSERAVADVSADGDPYTGVAVYDSTPDPSEPEHVGWGTIGGTSVASPIIASIFALAGGSHGIAHPAETLYANLTATPGSLHDVTSGSNGFCGKPFNELTGTTGCSTSEEGANCSGKGICVATSGYDGPSGVGTPIGLAAFQPTNSQHTSDGEPTGGEEEPTTTGEGEHLRETPIGNPGGQEPGPTNLGTSGGATGSTTPPSGTTSPTGSSGSTGSTTTANRTGVRLSGLALTLSAIAALNHAHPRMSQIGFAFTLSVPARVRVTLARQVRVQGHARWSTEQGAFAITAAAGRTRAHLQSRHQLSPGRYLLTCTPAQGSPQSLVLVLG